MVSNVKGYYVLLIYVKANTEILVGKLGVKNFKKGYYVYTGSALGKGALSLGGRIRRHIRRQKTVKWHIDYLLSDENASVKAVMTSISEQKMECRINKRLKEVFHGQTPIMKFGASDCKENCYSHLLYLGLIRNAADRIIKLLLHEVKGDIYVLRFC
ncbi:GIY-YIG nuclease family protein [Candidatus Bathyarchaeota archaeon]|nr:GIY-YIG nuclease family protein [Candidatus Bathyarchaeota archaeon]